MNKIFHKISPTRVAIALMVALLATACSTTKTTTTITTKPSGSGTPTQTVASEAAKKVIQAMISEQNITADLNITIAHGDNEISAPGSLHMRRGEMIRLQVNIPLLGTEVGRIEFTPTTVTVIDRLHKQYMKASYDDVSFLADNGLTFYSLQSLFWNQLFVPGQNSVDTKSISAFQTSTTADGQSLTLSLEKNNICYKWTAQASNGLIDKADISYNGTSNKATLDWAYSKFKALGSKQFPSQQVISVTANTSKKKESATLTLKLSSIDNSSKWDTTTSISKKYKQVSPTEAFKKLFGN